MIVLGLRGGADGIDAHPLAARRRVAGLPADPAVRSLEAGLGDGDDARRRERGVDAGLHLLALDVLHAEAVGDLEAAVGRHEGRAVDAVSERNERRLGGLAVEVDEHLRGRDVELLPDAGGHVHVDRGAARGIDEFGRGAREREGRDRSAEPPDEEPALEVAADDRAAREVRIDAPEPVELRAIVARVGVEVRGLDDRGDGAGRRHVEDAQARAVVGREHLALVRVAVVRDRGRRVLEVADEDGRREVLDIEDVGRRERLGRALVELVAEEEEPAVLGEPALVAVAPVRVDDRAEQGRRGLVGDIDDVEAGVDVAAVLAAAAEGDLLARVGAVGVGDDLRVVDVDVVVLPDEDGRTRVREVVDAQAARTAAAAVEEAAVLVDRHVVARRGAAGRDRVDERRRTTVDRREVDDLDAATALGHDVAVLVVGLAVAPEAARAGNPRLLRGVHRVGDLVDRHAVVHAHERVLAAARAHIAPAVVPARTGGVDRVERVPALELDVERVELAGDAAFLTLAVDLRAHGALAVADLAVVLVGDERSGDGRSGEHAQEGAAGAEGGGRDRIRHGTVFLSAAAGPPRWRARRATAFTAILHRTPRRGEWTDSGGSSDDSPCYGASFAVRGPSAFGCAAHSDFGEAVPRLRRNATRSDLPASPRPSGSRTCSP